MKNKKSILAALLATVIFASTLSSCVGDPGVTIESSSDSEKNTEIPTEIPTEGVTEEESGTPIDPDTVENYVNPQFSISGGLYSEAQSLELSLPSGYEDHVIYYTTDGTVPTRASEIYTEPLVLLSEGGSVVIRAICYEKLEESENTQESKIVKGSENIEADTSSEEDEPAENEDLPAGKVITHTYIYTANPSSTLWTVSLTADTQELSMLMNDYNESIEIPSHTEIITPEGNTVISQDTGLRIFGGSSRSLPQKSFKVIARKDDKLGAPIYTGKGSFSYPLFEDRTVRSGEGSDEVLTKYDSFILRNGGNDSLQSTAQDPLKPNLLRDSLSNRFAAMTTDTFDHASTQFAVVYVNGEYYGLLDMRENMNEDYAKNVYGVDDDQVVVIKSELDTSRQCKYHKKLGYGDCRFCGVWFFYEVDEEFSSYLDEWTALCEKAINATDEEYDEIFAEIESSVDLDSFAEYFALNLYLSNTDWPHNNVRLWKYTGEQIDGVEVSDGKWRFMYRDMDFTIGRYNSPDALAELNTVYSVDTFYRALGNYQDYGIENANENRLYADSLYLQGLFDFCLKNDDFRASFVDICEKMSSDESTQAMLTLLDELVAEVEPGMEDHLERWNGTYHRHYDLEAWYASIEEMRDYINNRPAAFRNHLYFTVNLYAPGTYEIVT